MIEQSDGSALADPSLRIPVPSSDVQHWENANCGDAFGLLGECIEDRELPWYMEDCVITPIIWDIDVSYSSFQRAVALNGWPKPKFWEPPAQVSDASISASPRRRVVRMPVEERAMLTNRIESVIAKAQRMFSGSRTRPEIRVMARELYRQGLTENYSVDTVRQILSGKYRPMVKLGIRGLGDRG